MTSQHQTSRFCFASDREAHLLSTHLSEAMGCVLDTAPTNLPPLYDAVDSDALDTLFVPHPLQSESEASPAYPAEVVFSWCEHGVRIRQTGEITITDQPATPSLDSDSPPDVFAGTSAGDPPPAYHAYAQARDLATAVVVAVADVCGCDPTTLRERLYDRINPEALTTLFKPKHNGTSRAAGSVSFAFAGYFVTVTSTGLITLVSELEQLKEDGGNVLVIGDVPDDVFDMSRAFLCEESDPHSESNCHELIALLEKTPRDSQHQDTPAPDPGNQVGILKCRNPVIVRSTGGSENTHVYGSHVSSVSGELADFRRAVIQALANTDPGYTNHDKGENRLCVDSLRPLITDTDCNEHAFLTAVCQAGRGAGTLGYYFVPQEREAVGMDELASVVDAVIELRVSERGPEQRWHLQQTGSTTEWFTLER